jgi:uncharacterized integral membrane protein
MWVIKWIAFVLMMLIVLAFAYYNHEQTVSVQLFNWVSPILPVYLVLFVAFAVGILAGILMSSFNIFKFKYRAHQLNKENKMMKDELNRLRNANIEEELKPSELDRDKETERKVQSRKKRPD